MRLGGVDSVFRTLLEGAMPCGVEQKDIEFRTTNKQLVNDYSIQLDAKSKEFHMKSINFLQTLDDFDLKSM